MAGGFAFSLVLLLRLTQDIRRFGQALRVAHRTGVVSSRIYFRTRMVQSAWNIVLLFLRKAQWDANSRTSYDRLLSLTARLAAASHDNSSTARELVDAVLAETSSEVQAAAVLVRSEENEVRIPCAEGIPMKRVESALLMCFEKALGQGDHRAEIWHYYDPDTDPCFDFTVFGIGLSLFVPLTDHRGMCGAIWLGCRAGASLSSERKEMLRIIAQHAAASFHAAEVARAQSEASRRERDFLLGLSHDVRAPGVRALYAVRELLSGRNAVMDGENRRQLKVVERSIAEQLRLLGDVLEYSKHQKGLLNCETCTVALSLLLREVSEDYSQDFSERDIKFYVEGAENINVIFDPQHLKRIVSNFLANALKYTDQGSVKLCWKRTACSAEIYVVDTGIGVSPADRPLLFTQFRRGTAGRKRDGIGLGLALCKALGALNKANVFYRPLLPNGSVFGIVAPLAPAVGQTGVSPPLKVGTILIVDDDPAVCRTHARYLSSLAGRVVPAGSIKEALEYVDACSPDVIVCDVHLRDGCADELLSQMSSQLPAVIVSGDGNWTQDYRKQNVSRKNLIVLEKPASRETVIQAVTALCFDAGVAKAA